MGAFEPSNTFQGARAGYIFKLGVKGLGYYEDATIHEMEARSRAEAEKERRAAIAELKGGAAGAADNPEEIELDMDLDEEVGEEAAAPTPARPAANNPEEIELNFEDIVEQSVPAEVFGGGLAKVRDSTVDETPEEPPLSESAQADPKASGSRAMGALSRFQQRKGGKGKGGGRG